jgi:hypothetical protein
MKQKEANLASEAFIKALKKAIFDPEGSKAAWVKSLLVKEISEGETAREGLVQVFDPIDHPKTNIRHAWSYGLDNSKKRRFFAGSQQGSIHLPQAVVRGVIVDEFYKTLKMADK